jgi:hypothetical protein
MHRPLIAVAPVFDQPGQVVGENLCLDQQVFAAQACSQP